MLDSVLVANRGEIARRVIRTARRMGIRTVAVYSDADGDLPYVREADETAHIGPAQPARSYLDAAAIIEAARDSGAAAVHPGYGFLAENADFARQVIAAGLIWVGPDPGAVDRVVVDDQDGPHRVVPGQWMTRILGVAARKGSLF